VSVCNQSRLAIYARIEVRRQLGHNKIFKIVRHIRSSAGGGNGGGTTTATETLQ
jgi:hypothetical protein